MAARECSIVAYRLDIAVDIAPSMAVDNALQIADVVEPGTFEHPV